MIVNANWTRPAMTALVMQGPQVLRLASCRFLLTVLHAECRDCPGRGVAVVSDTGHRLGVWKLTGHRIDTSLRLRQRHHILAILASLGGVQVHARISVLDHPWQVLTVMIEAPLKSRWTEWKRVRLVVAHTGHPEVPGLAVAVHLALQRFLFCHVGKTR